MRHIRGRQLQPDIIVPIPKSWKFLPEEQLQVTIGTPDLPRYKLVYDEGGFFSGLALKTPFALLRPLFLPFAS